MEFFSIRTYGILINQNKEILISDELYHGQRFSKFPGGGVELGEGVTDALKREFVEECDLTIDKVELLYVTDRVVKSMFNNSQVLGVYYQVFTDNEVQVPIKTEPFDFEPGTEQSFRWLSLDSFSEENLTFEMDREAWLAMRMKILV